MIKIINDKGMIWCVRVVVERDTYGADFCLTHDNSEPLVEFYDCRYEHTQYGQFVTRYSLSTVLDHAEGYGLTLHGGVPDWRVSVEGMNRIIGWLEMEEL